MRCEKFCFECMQSSTSPWECQESAYVLPQFLEEEYLIGSGILRFLILKRIRIFLSQLICHSDKIMLFRFGKLCYGSRLVMTFVLRRHSLKNQIFVHIRT